MSEKIEKAKNYEKTSSKKSLITKEKYGDLWNKIFYACLCLTVIGTINLIMNFRRFRNTLISLNPSYEFPKYFDFLICIPIFIFLSIFK